MAKDTTIRHYATAAEISARLREKGLSDSDVAAAREYLSKIKQRGKRPNMED